MRVYTGFWSLYRKCLCVCPVTLQTAMNTTNYLSMNPFDSFLPPNSFRSNRKASSTTGAPMRSACTRSSPPGKGGGLARGALHVPMRPGRWPLASKRLWLRPRCPRTFDSAPAAPCTRQEEEGAGVGPRRFVGPAGRGLTRGQCGGGQRAPTRWHFRYATGTSGRTGHRLIGVRYELLSILCSQARRRVWPGSGSLWTPRARRPSATLGSGASSARRRGRMVAPTRFGGPLSGASSMRRRLPRGGGAFGASPPCALLILYWRACLAQT